MDIEKETREMFMSLPAWNARDALRMLLEVNPYSVIQEDDFDGTELEVEVRALIGWLYRFGILPRAIREPDNDTPELIDDYLETIGEVRRTPAEWIAAASANPGAPAEWLALLQPPSGVPDSAAPIEILKSGALVKEFSYIWPSIEGDIRDKTRHANTLLNEANIKHGYYDVEKALRWAKTEGKIIKQKAETYCKTSTDSVFSAIIGQIYNLN